MAPISYMGPGETNRDEPPGSDSRPAGEPESGATAESGRQRAPDDLIPAGDLVDHAPAAIGNAELQQEARYRALFNTSLAAVLLIDSTGRIVMANAAATEMLGRSIEELHELPPQGIIDSSDPRLPIALQERRRTGRYRGELTLSRGDGTSFPAEIAWATFTDETGGIWNSVIIRDITDEKRTGAIQRFLVESGRALVTILEYDELTHTLARLVVPRLADFSAVDLIGDKGASRRAAVAHHNPELEKALLGVPCVFKPPETPELIAEVSDAWLRDTIRDPECLAAVRRLAPRSIMILPLIARGQALGTLTLYSTRPDRLYDKTDLSAAESLANHAALAIDNARHYHESRQATQIRDEVLAVVSHDLRNPLHTISLSAGLLAEILPSDGEQARTARHQIEIIQRSTERANHLIRDLLDVATMQTSGIPLQRAATASLPLLREVVDLHRPLANEAAIELELAAPEALPPIYADHDRILQVFGNLIGNAIKFTRSGGHVTVHAALADDMIRFAVTDTGPGIPEEDFPHLFDPFWQAIKGAKGGVGLGLPIARGIVEAHAGKIWVESEVGRGTTIFFTIPTPAAQSRVDT